MNSALLALPMAAILVALFSPIAMRIAMRVGAVSVPGGRHVHERRIPRLGGLAIAAATLLAITCIVAFDPAVLALLVSRGKLVVGALVGSVAMCGLGVLDDTRGIRATRKLAVQLVVAVFAFECGFRIDGIHLPFLGDIPLGYLALPCTLVWIVGVVNAVNLIDGLDGLAAGVVLFAASVNVFVGFTSGDLFSALVSAAIGGAALGFLFHNFNPARIFMGDSGSYFFGYVLAVTGLMSHKASTAVSLLVPMVALGVPIVDTLFAMVRRILERRSVFSPDRGHIHHRLLDMGITHRRAVLIIYGVSVLCTVIAIGMWLERSMELAGGILAGLVVIGGLVRFGGAVGSSLTSKRQRERLRVRDAEMLRRALPNVPASFGRACTEAELFEALSAFAEAADLSFVRADVFVAAPARAQDNAEPLFRWASSPSSTKRGLVEARYPVGTDVHARIALTFGWTTEYDEVSPQSDILLQVASDVFATCLTRLGSQYAPEAAGPAPVDDRPSDLIAVASGSSPS